MAENALNSSRDFEKNLKDQKFFQTEFALKSSKNSENSFVE